MRRLHGGILAIAWNVGEGVRHGIGYVLPTSPPFAAPHPYFHRDARTGIPHRRWPIKREWLVQSMVPEFHGQPSAHQLDGNVERGAAKGAVSFNSSNVDVKVLKGQAIARFCQPN